MSVPCSSSLVADRDIHVETIWTALVGALFAVWFAASVVHQIAPSYFRRALGRDLPGLLPRWTFFAPRPAHEDTHIVFREQREGGWSPWRALTPATAPRAWRWAWNPQRYPRKAAVDLADGIRRSLARFADQPRAIVLSNSYVGLLHWVMRQPAEQGVVSRQFAIVTSHVADETPSLGLLFVSEAHEIDR